ncbi:TPA: excisionase family protein [Salmonella enterica subsp. salamae serovar 21:z10:[z6]]|uniref:Excisionase family protein n=1 Tax=Salmonella enterica subsp. salamae serovar 42:f,g,t:-- TaxID=41518 RepID=A0A737H516_SALER|nr:excisionase family protein [Salmonella enterica]EBO9194817.1 excisionase [Salmonella enterica]EGK5349362.1 excisionase family protein [Salmonella enterica]KKA52454.1 excisionase [Salmonella enterica subsp. salamae serovar 42:f,g,t:--]HAE8208665.1 excisionase family protein [Salmonella enterica subsp. salamae serovar 42:f,g,t:--]HAK1935748.1 excisionase family protein [Salmonella enterica]
MQTIIYQIAPNDWVTEKLLIAATGLKPGTILRARKESWFVGREYKHITLDGEPKPNGECLYHLPTINRWIGNMPDPDVDL